MHISELYCYPIKSCGGIRLSEARVGPRGIEHDREYMIIDANIGMFAAQRKAKGLGIEVKSLCKVRTWIEDTDTIFITAPGRRTVYAHPSMQQQEVVVQVWNTTGIRAYDMGNHLADWFSSFLSQERPGKYRLVRIADDFFRKAKQGTAQVGFGDAYPLMGLEQASIDGLNERLANKGQGSLPVNRFRPNFVFSGGEPHAEDHMKVVKIGGDSGIVLDGMTLCERCPLPCTNQETAVRLKEPSATWGQYRRGRHIGIMDPAKQSALFFGRNFNHRGPGYIRVGDTVEVLERD